MANSAFGGRSTTIYDTDLIRGWGKRNYNWEFSAGVQQQVMPRVAADVSYFRRAYGNLIVTDNLATVCGSRHGSSLVGESLDLVVRTTSENR